MVRRSVLATWVVASVLAVVAEGAGVTAFAASPVASPGTGAGPGSSPGAIAAVPAADEILAAGSCQAGVMSAHACVTRDIGVWRGVPYTPPVTADGCTAGSPTCSILMDVYAPTAAGPWPLVVVVPGGDMAPDATRSYVDDFALSVADRGAVVMTAEWRQRLGHPDGDVDVACAVGVARQTGPGYGADPARVVLVGHSNGVPPVVGAGLAIPPLVPDAGSCDATSGSLRPDAMMVISGLFDLDAVGQVAGSATPDQRIPVVVAQGGRDSSDRVAAAEGLQALLVADGWDSTLVEVPTADHPRILYKTETVDALMNLTTTP